MSCKSHAYLDFGPEKEESRSRGKTKEEAFSFIEIGVHDAVEVGVSRDPPADPTRPPIDWSTAFSV